MLWDDLSVAEKTVICGLQVPSPCLAVSCLLSWLHWFGIDWITGPTEWAKGRLDVITVYVAKDCIFCTKHHCDEQFVWYASSQQLLTFIATVNVNQSEWWNFVVSVTRLLRESFGPCDLDSLCGDMQTTDDRKEDSGLPDGSINSSTESPNNGVGQSEGSSDQQRIQYLEQSIRFLHNQHQQLVANLHDEVDQLKRKNRGLHMLIVFPCT
jgi:Coiled-coil domain of unknown function